MPPALRHFLTSGRFQLNIIGIGLLGLLGFSAWNVAHPLTPQSLLPLIFIGYAMLRIVWELTWNRKNVPTLATSYAGRTRIAEILRQEAEQRNAVNYTILDLGSGRGELTRAIARAIPQALVVGIELLRFPFWQSVFVQRFIGPKNLSYRRLDFWSYDCSPFDAVVLYLSVSVSPKAGVKLFQELKPGSTVISHNFPLLDTWMQVDVFNFKTPFKETIYVYRKP